MRDDKERAPFIDMVAPESPCRDNVILRSEKKPYRKPTYRYEKVFETRALACGKIHPTEFQCRFHRHS